MKPDKDDSKWDYNSSECETAGDPLWCLPVFLDADTAAKAKSEANHVVSLITGKEVVISDLL